MSFEPSKIREWTDYITGEWKVIRQAPVTFLVALFLLGYAINWRLDSSYKSDYTNRLELKDEQIKTKEEQLKGKDDQLKGKDDQLKSKDDYLKGKDDLLNEYRERLHLLPPAQSSYSRLTNAELQQKALAVVQQLRQFLEKSRNPSVFPAYPPNASEEEKNRIWQQYTLQSIQASQNLISAYNNKFKDEVILLHDELRSRLVTTEEKPGQTFLYETANNALVMEMVASDLGRLAKSLPVTGSGK